MLKKYRKKLLKALLDIVIICLLSFILTSINLDNKKTVFLSTCVDGDTAKFIIDGEIKSVRFLAIDTPESVHPTIADEPFGEIASAFTCESLREAQTITLEYETSTTTDKYNRVLAWVFIDDVLLQGKIIDLGYGEVAYLYGDYKYTALLQEKEAIAKANKVGLWYNE